MINNKKEHKNKKLLIIGCIAIIVVIIGACFFGGDPLKGTWSYDGTTVFEFNGHGKGALCLPNSTYEFIYEIDEDNKVVSIDFIDENATDYTYSYIVDKDNLTLYGKVDKETFEYLFVKQ